VNGGALLARRAISPPGALNLLRETKTLVKSVPVLGPLLRAAARPFARKEAESPFRRYCRCLPDLVPSPVFVKVGANDGITGDSTSDIFLADERWKGLLIEPVPACFQALRSNFSDSRRFAVQQIAIGRSNGTAVFYFVGSEAEKKLPNLPSWYDQLGSFDKNHILKHLHGALEPFIVEHTIPVRPLDEVLRENHLPEVHFLEIDTEGFDYEVLTTVNLAAKAPAAILVEHKHLDGSDKTRMLTLLREHGYRVEDCNRADYFAVHRSSPLRKVVRDTARVQ
jgi:FkbM family methyltransferase